MYDDIMDIDEQADPMVAPLIRAMSSGTLTMDTTTTTNNASVRHTIRSSFRVEGVAEFVPISKMTSTGAMPNSSQPHPLHLPEILLHIFSFLQTPIKTGTDPTQPVDFVKVDSIKYSISKPRLYNCSLVNKLWNECANVYLWRTVQISSEKGYKRLLRTLGPSSVEGQLRQNKIPATLFTVSDKTMPSVYLTNVEPNEAIKQGKRYRKLLLVESAMRTPSRMPLSESTHILIIYSE
jgi:hypothetical protein